MIESTRNSRVVEAVRLKQAKHRRDSGRILLEGPNLVEAALDAGVGLETYFTLEKDDLARMAQASGAEVVLVTEQVMRKLADTDQPRGPVVVAQLPAEPEIRAVDTIVMCGLRDPGNAGTLIRSAAAFGFQVVTTPRTVDVWSPKVLRSAAGGHFMTPVIASASLDAVTAAGVELIALVPASGGIDIPELDLTPVGLMVGNEAHGLSSKELAAAASTLTVPTTGAVESLNAAVAGSIAMFAIAQSR